MVIRKVLWFVILVLFVRNFAYAAYQQSVYDAQQALTDKGYDPGPVDGFFGRKTAKAIRKFQTDSHLTVTGRLNPETQFVLTTAENIVALFQAINQNNIDTVKQLLRSDLDVNVKNHEQRTPLFMAAGNGYIEIMLLLFKSQAEIDSRDHLQMTPLFIAAQQGHTTAVRLLLEMGAMVDATDKYGRTPLLKASQQGFIGIVKLLLKAKAKVNSTANNGVTPLHIAAQEGHAAIVKLLLEAHADGNKVLHLQGKDYTALSLAKQMQHTHVVELLEKFSE